MALYNIGNFIKQRREELGITQNELAEGLCSPVTLSRLENGTQTPHQSTVRALLQRLGYSDALMFQAAGREEFEIAQLKVKIRQLYNTRDRDGARELFAKLGEYKGFFSVSDRQFYEIIYVLLNKENIPVSKAAEMLENAIRLTHPNYRRDNPPKVLCYEESLAMINIAVFIDMGGERDNAIDVLYYLKRYYEQHFIDIENVKKMLPMIMYDLSKILGLAGRYDECIEVCMQGIRTARKTANYSVMAQTLYNLSWALVKRNRPCDAEPAKNAAIEAYTLAEILQNRPGFPERVKKFIIDNFGEDSL